MAYSTIDDLKELQSEATLIKLSNDEKGATEVDMVNINAAIAKGDKVIDGYVGVQQTVPMSPVPGMVSTISANMGIYNLYRRRNQVPEDWDKQYRADVALLVKISTGKITLGAADKAVDRPAGTLSHSSSKVMGGSGGMLEKF